MNPTVIANLVDVAIPLVAGTLMTAYPQIFLKRRDNEIEMANKKTKLRMFGGVLLGVAGLYLFLALK